MFPINRSGMPEIPLAPHESGGGASSSQVATVGQEALSALGKRTRQEASAASDSLAAVSLEAHQSLQAHLQAWCDEKTGTPEHAKRLEAKQRIEQCFRESSSLLDLSSLELSSLPSLEGFSFPTLKGFKCSRNQLRVLPHFSRVMPVLKWFGAAHNLLEILPEPMLSWSARCEIHVEENHFSPAYSAIVQTSLNRIRDSDPALGPQIYFIYVIQTLKVHLQAWCDEKAATPEYTKRLEAKQRIEQCFRESSSLLDLSSLELSSLPSFEGFYFSFLKLFDCRRNQLKVLPDFSSMMPALKRFFCSNNQLKVLPDFRSVMPAMKIFYCSNNLLETLPEVMLSWLASCEIQIAKNKFSMGYIQTLQTSLAAIRAANLFLGPKMDFSAYVTAPLQAHLQAWCDEKAETPEHIKRLEAKQRIEYCLRESSSRLDISSLELTSLPSFDGFYFPALKGFKCSRNQLVALPDFSRLMPALRQFDCRSNQIRVLPDFSSVMSDLGEFNCSMNLITQLPEVMSRWPRECWIHAENNRFSRIYSTTLIALRAQIQLSNPTLGPRLRYSIHDAAASPLDQTITFWLEAFKVAFPKASHEALWITLNEREFPNFTASGSIDSGAAGAFSELAEDSFLSAYQLLLGHEKKEALNQFLYQLIQTADYKHAGSKKNVIFKVQRFLSGAARNESFREQMFLLIDEALSSCGDRVSFYLGKIEVQWKLTCEGSSLDQLGLAQLLMGVKRVDLLEAQASQIVSQHRLGDVIETFLYCQVNLKGALRLPLSTEGMLYPAMSGVTAAMLESAKDAVLAQTTSKEAVCALLCESDYWMEFLKKDPASEFDAINEECSHALEALDAEMLGSAHQAELNRIAQEQKGRQQSLVLSLTQDWLESHFAELSL